MITQEEKELEEMMRNRVLYIGKEVPEALIHDPRPKFVLLGTPAELLEDLEALLKSHDAEMVNRIKNMPVGVNLFDLERGKVDAVYKSNVLALFNPKGN